MALSWCFLRPLGCSSVLVNQAMEDLPALDPVPLEYSIAWLICAVTCSAEAMLAGWLAGCCS
jgi:hypothetical protein